MVGIINVWISLGGGGEAVSFAYDGATFTPGEFVEDSGNRDVEIELTLDGNAITSGTFSAIVGCSLDSNFDSSTTPMRINGTGEDSYGVNLDAEYSSIILLLFIADEACVGTLNLESSAPSASDRYLFLLLPTGEVVASTAISIPGTGGGMP